MADKKQKTAPLSMKKQFLIITGLMVVLFVFAFCIYSADGIWNNIKQANNNSPGMVTIEGVVVCLPHKDTTGPQTEECAIGLKSNSGKYYGVKNRDITSNLGTNQTVKVSGVMEYPTDSKYDIVGMINAG